MCWILGLSAVFTKVLQRAFPEHKMAADIAEQFEHVTWDGFRFYDLIFPLFLFLSGVSLAIAVPRRVGRDGRGAAARHLLARALIIFVLGVIFSGGLKDGWDQIRWLGVLQRIGIASAAAGLLSLWLDARGLGVAAAVLLVGYFLLLRFVPVPGVGAGNFAEGMNLTNYLDSIWLPGRKYNGDHDPEGILSTVPAIATALLGLLAGKWITTAQGGWIDHRMHRDSRARLGLASVLPGHQKNLVIQFRARGCRMQRIAAWSVLCAGRCARLATRSGTVHVGRRQSHRAVSMLRFWLLPHDL